LLAGLGSGFPRIRTVMADAGYQSGKKVCEKGISPRFEAVNHEVDHG